MNKLIPLILKLIGLGLVLPAFILPLFSVGMAITWENDVKPPLAPDDFSIEFVTINGQGMQVNNITYDEDSNSFVQTDLSPDSDVANFVEVINSPILIIFVALTVLGLLGAIFVLLSGRSLLGGLFTLLGGASALIVGSVFVIGQGIISTLLETTFGGTVTNGIITYSQTITVLSFTYTLDFTLSLVLGLAAYLLIAGGLIQLVSLVFRSDEH